MKSADQLTSVTAGPLKCLTAVCGALLFVFLVLATGTIPAAHGQEAAEAPKTVQGAKLDPEQLETLLSTLKNEQQRDAFIANLETLLAASRADEGAGEKLKVEEAVSGIFISLSELIELSVTQLTSVAVSLTDVDSLLPGITALAEDPEDLLKFGRWGLLFALVAGSGLLGAHLYTKATRRLVDRLETWMENGALLQSSIAMLPLVALRAVGAGIFLAISQGIVSLIQVETAPLISGRVLVFAIASHLVCLAVLRTLLHPAGVLSRVLEIQPPSAAYLIVWSNRIIATGIYGILGLQGAYILGMPYATYLFLDKIVYALIWLLLVVFILQNRTSVAQYVHDKTVGSSGRFFWSLFSASWHLWAIALVTIRIVTQLANPAAVEFRLIEVLVLMTGIIVFWRAAWRLVDMGGLSAFSVSRDLTDRYPSLEKRANLYLPHLLGAAKILLSIVSIGALLQIWGIPVAEFAASETGRTLARTLVAVILMTGAALVVAEMISLFIERRLHVLDIEGRLGGRERTLLPLVRNALLVVIAVFTAFFVLSELGIDITPLLAGASIVGLAIGFGAQSLVKDMISGVFLLIEDTLNVGDYVDVGGKTGTVEALSIRTLRLRDVAGDLHTIPFGSVDTITNMTKEFAFALVDVGIAYREDADEVMKLLNEIGTEMVEDEKIKDSVLGPFEVFGVQDLADSSVNIRTRVRTKAGMQWSVRREFLRRVKRRFDTEGIEIPFPHQTLYFGENKDGSAPPAFVQVSEAKARRTAKPEPGTAAPAEDYFETANPEQADAEAARNAEKESQEAERRQAEEERVKAAEEAKRVEEELAHDESAGQPAGKDGSADKKTQV